MKLLSVVTVIGLACLTAVNCHSPGYSGAFQEYGPPRHLQSPAAPWFQFSSPQQTPTTSWYLPQSGSKHLKSPGKYFPQSIRPINIPLPTWFEQEKLSLHQTPVQQQPQRQRKYQHQTWHNPFDIPLPSWFPQERIHSHQTPTAPWFRQQRTRPQQPPTFMDIQRIGNQQTPSRLPISCRSPSGQNGVCQPLSSCEPLLTILLANPQNSRIRNELQLSNQICGNSYAVVCCPLTAQLKDNSDNVPTKLPTIADGCGYQEGSGGFKPQVVGGEPSALGAWPWIALIGYSGGSASPFKCGGTLITSRHVLTAAHCVKRSLSFVRLGEHDLSTTTETKHVDVPVSKVLKHPQFDQINGHNDIAMLLLARNVQITEKIATICLPFAPELQTKPSNSQRPYIAGWGRTMEGGQPADILQQLQVAVYDNSECKASYEKEKKLTSQKQFDDSVVCAGDFSGGKDSCQGDSGGPLMDNNPSGFKGRFHLIGIVSYGIGCARPNTPGVYTNVVYFINWITNAVRTMHL